jgi:RimJ/RimL family protein N-acetyltransferase
VWGRGYAPEAAQAVLTDAFGRARLDEVVSITASSNHKSRRVMEKIGLRHDPDGGFIHPRAAEHLNPHVSYRLTAGEYRSTP